MEETRNASPYSNGEDRISRLHDSLIHYILSSIDTKYVVQTSVLSRRWIHVWKSIPYLKVKRNSFPRGKEHDQRFIDFVDMVFILGNESDIQGFSLDWYNYNDDDILSKYVKRWIVHAVKRNVQEISLEICQYYHSTFEIPHQLLNCKSLRKLEMEVISGAEFADVILPKSMDLPRLKVLQLRGFSISDEELSKRLFSSCPVLKTLEIYSCDIPNLIVNSLSLENFVYKQFRSTMANVIKLTAPNLKDFECRSSVTQHYSLEKCSLLSNVQFDIRLKERLLDENAEAWLNLSPEEKQVYAKRMIRFLGVVYMVKEIWLSSGFLEVLSAEADLLDCQPPRLCNLRYLSLQMRSTRGCLRAIAYLLKISPRIDSIFLNSEESNSVEVGDDWEAGLSSPGMLSHLELVTFDEVEGCDAELKLLTFLLKYAKVLRKVALSFRAGIGSPDGVRQRKVFRDKVRALPAASSDIKMMFLNLSE